MSGTRCTVLTGARGLGLLVLVLVGQATPALAREAPDGGVEVTLVGSVAENGDLRRLLSEWNASLEIRLSNQLNADDILSRTRTNGQLRIWVVLSSPELAILYFKDPSGERYLVREVPLSAGLDEPGRETLAQVIATSASAFVDKQVSSNASEVEASLRKDETLERAPLPAAPVYRSFESAPSVGRLKVSGMVALLAIRQATAIPALWRPHLGAFYAATLVSANELGHGPGASFGASRLTESSRWDLAAQAQYRWPLPVDARGVTLELRTLAASVIAAWERPAAHGLRIGFELGLGVEVTKVHATATADSGVETRPDTVHARPIAVPCLRVGTRLGPLGIAASVGIQAAIVRTHYDVVDRIYTPWLIAPRSAIEVYW